MVTRTEFYSPDLNTPRYLYPIFMVTANCRALLRLVDTKLPFRSGKMGMFETSEDVNNERKEFSAAAASSCHSWLLSPPSCVDGRKRALMARMKLNAVKVPIPRLCRDAWSAFQSYLGARYLSNARNPPSEVVHQGTMEECREGLSALFKSQPKTRIVSDSNGQNDQSGKKFPACQVWWLGGRQQFLSESCHCYLGPMWSRITEERKAATRTSSSSHDVEGRQQFIRRLSSGSLGAICIPM